jgi:hypothetical protein
VAGVTPDHLEAAVRIKFKIPQKISRRRRTDELGIVPKGGPKNMRDRHSIFSMAGRKIPNEPTPDKDIEHSTLENQSANRIQN